MERGYNGEGEHCSRKNVLSVAVHHNRHSYITQMANVNLCYYNLLQKEYNIYYFLIIIVIHLC